MAVARFPGVGIPLQIIQCVISLSLPFFFGKKLVELFSNYNNVGCGSVPQVVVDSTRDPVVYDFFDNYLVFYP